MNRKHIVRQLKNKGIAFDHTLSTDKLNDLLNTPDAINRFAKSFNYADGGGKISVAYNSANTDSPVDITIAEDIGKDAWTGKGFGVNDIQAALDLITPKTRTLNFLVDSAGGSVNTGCAIHNLLQKWPGVINKTIIGVAASTASWCFPADKTFAYKNSQMFMHRAMCYVGGNVDDLQQGIDFLNKTDRQIAGMYADQTGNDADEMLDMMANETLLTGPEAVELGLVDEIIDGDATNNFSIEWLNSAKQKLHAQNKLTALQQTNIQNMQKKIALLNKRGITPPANATEVELDSLIAASDAMRVQNKAILTTWNVAIPEDATDAAIVTLVTNGKPTTATNQPDINQHPTIIALNAQIAQNRRKDILVVVEKAASDGKIAVLEIDNWTNDAAAAVDHPTNGNPVLARLNKLEGHAPGFRPLPIENTKLEVTSSGIKDIIRGFENYDIPRNAWIKGQNISEGRVTEMEVIRNNAVNKALFFRKFRNRFVEVFNTNTISAGLQRQVILNDIVIRDFARRVINLGMFSTVFRDVPLQGTHKVEVPYFDLDTSASQSFSSTTGYNTLSNTSSDVREIVVGEGATGTGGFNVGHNRAYIGLSFTSQEIARQPYLKIAELAGLKAEKLAFDIFQDVLSVITAANFGAPPIVKSAANFDSDTIADLVLACKAWPQMGRALMLDSAYHTNLLKDPSFKFALNAASDLAIKEGRLFPRVEGFDYTENPNLSNLANPGIANLVGFAVWKYAILVAFAPVPPIEEVRNAGTTWEMIVDPATGISLEYRQFGDNVLDTAKNIIESSYGFAKGLGTALKPIVSA